MASSGGSTEIVCIPGKLYYVALRSNPTESAKELAHYWSADEFSYWNFFLDWGPLSLGNLFRFCRTLNFKLKSEKLVGKAIHVYSGPHAHKRTNAAFLLSAWLLLYGGKTPEQAFAPFQNAFPPFPPFHDASPCVCTFDLFIPDCLRGLQRARRFGFFNFSTFDVGEYEHYEQVENGDLNWLVDGKFLAFAGPHSRSEMTREGYRTLTPRNYIPYFMKHNVTLVVRLNKKYYDEGLFLDAGIDHLDAYFLDGSVPPPHVIRQFIAACEATPGAVAVHCKAGLGRTGTCIGCYLMKHYSFTAAEVIGWMRICRPGSVIGPQQHYLERMEGPMHREGLAYRQQVGVAPSPRRPPRSLSQQRGVQGEHWAGQSTGARASHAHAGREGETMAAWTRGQNAKDPARELGKARHAVGEPRPAPAAAAVGRRSSSSYVPRSYTSPLEAFAGRHASRQEGSSPRRMSPHSDRQGSRKTETCSGGSGSTSRRKSTGVDQPRQHQVSSLSPLQRGSAAGWASRDVALGERGRGGGGGGAAATAYGNGASTQRARETISVTGLRRASVPAGRSEGKSVPTRSSMASPAEERLIRAANAAAEEAAAMARSGRAKLGVWEEEKSTEQGGALGGGWASEGRTQGDYLLQQRVRGGASRR